MNQPAEPIDSDAFLAALRDRSAKGVYTITLDGKELPVSVELRDSPNLVFTFTGAVRRDDGPLPRFATGGLKNYVSASFIRLADPSLALNDEIRLAWYAGHEGFELQKLLPELIHQIIDSLDATRVAFIGVSGGGFASLYYSWKTPGSVAIALNPQTNLDLYQGGLLQKRYRLTCWPALGEKEPLNTVIDADLCTLYASRCVNTVMLFQTASDFGHLTQHFAPFVSAFPSGHNEQVVVRIDDWGVKGHQPAPAKIWIPWVAAALSAADTTATAIEETWAEQNPPQLPPLRRLPPIASRDEQIAALLARTATGSLLEQYSFERS